MGSAVGELKSAYEKAMERAERLGKLSPEEMRETKRVEFEPVGRALAETAALLFTSGYVDRMPASVFDSGRALSIHVYDLAMNVVGGEPRARATALVLVTILVAVNTAAARITARASGRSELA